MKIIIRLILVVAIGAGLTVGVLALKSKKEAEMAAFASKPRAITVVEATAVRKEVWQQYLPAIGNITAPQEVDVTSEVPGQITKIHFESGQNISTGDVLVTLDTSVDRAELAGLDAELRLSEVQFERSKRLLKDKTISKADFDIAEARRDEAIAGVAAKRAAISQKTIRAPFNGRLGIRKIDLGQYLEPGDPIVSLQKLDPIYIDFGTPERFLSALVIGESLSFTVQAYPNETFNGKLSAIESAIDRGTRNVLARAIAENPNEKLRPGMFADISLTVPKKDEVLTIPETAVNYTAYGNSVFVIEAGDGGLRVQRTQIETGEVRDGRVAVTSGLAEGQQIVALGHNKLRNGTPVRIDEKIPLSASVP